MRRIGMVAALLLLVGVLAACQITITYSQPTNPISTTANADNTTPVEPSVSVGPGSTVYFDVYVPSSIRINYPLVYFELSDTLDLTLINYTNYSPMASSSRTSVFASGTAGLQSLSKGGALTAQAIGANYPCHGSCIIWHTGSTSHYYLGVKNTGTSSATFNLYVYGFDYGDPYEVSGNDTMATAVDYPAGDESGAIETLQDVDWWHITGFPSGAQMSFSKVLGPISLELVLYDSGYSYQGTFYIGGSYPNSTTVPIRNGDYLEIRSSNGYAGATAASRYDLSY